jgi:hypothetical protein
MKLKQFILMPSLVASIVFSSALLAKTRTCTGSLDVTVTPISYANVEYDWNVVVYRSEEVIYDSETVTMSPYATGSATIANKARRKARDKLVSCFTKVISDSGWGENGNSDCEIVSGWAQSLYGIVYNVDHPGSDNYQLVSKHLNVYKVDVDMTVSGHNSHCDASKSYSKTVYAD